jgi:hypothetical protein
MNQKHLDPEPFSHSATADILFRQEPGEEEEDEGEGDGNSDDGDADESEGYSE